MNLDKFDNVVISRESLKTLLAWRDENKDFVRNYHPVMEEGVITYTDSSNYQEYFKQEGIKVAYKIFLAGVNVLSFQHNKLTGYVDKVEQGVDFKKLDYPLSEALQDVITVHASLMAYMEHFKSEKEYVTQTVTKISKKPQSNKKSSKNNVIKFKKVIKVHVPEIGELRKKRTAFERRTESWGVRGHWRTYKKTGKRSWVNSYVKGAGSKKSKTYSI